jgi:hypothetical protein
MTEERKEQFKTAEQRFPELDEDARRRAQARHASGTDAHAALAQESVLHHINKAYQPR